MTVGLTEVFMAYGTTIFCSLPRNNNLNLPEREKMCKRQKDRDDYRYLASCNSTSINQWYLPVNNNKNTMMLF